MPEGGLNTSSATPLWRWYTRSCAIFKSIQVVSLTCLSYIWIYVTGIGLLGCSLSDLSELLLDRWGLYIGVLGS